MAREGENPLNQSVQYLKGVGPARAEALKAVGVKTVSDLLYYVPRRYLDRMHCGCFCPRVASRRFTVPSRRALACAAFEEAISALARLRSNRSVSG